MDTTLWASQLVTFAAGAVTGGLVVYWTLTRRALRRTQGDRMTDQTRDRSKLAVFIIGLSVILVVFGLQVRADRADNKRDERRTEAYQAQQACLNRYSIELGEYLTDTLNTRVEANKRLDRAQKRLTRAGGKLSAANTAVVLVVAGGFDTPPTTTREDLVEALAQFRTAAAELNAANQAYERVDRETKDTLGRTGSPTKAYDPPKVDCPA